MKEEELMKKSFLCVVLTVLLIFSVAACGTTAKNIEEIVSQEVTGSGTEDETVMEIIDRGEDFLVGSQYIMKYEDSVELGRPNRNLNPQEIYASIDYIPQMFYGKYRVAGAEQGEQQFSQETEYIEWKNGQRMTRVPYKIVAGPKNLMSLLTNIKEYQWMTLYFYNDAGVPGMLECAYEIQGNEIIFTPLYDFDYDREQGKLSYSMYDWQFVYKFSFEGLKLTLSDGTATVDLYGGMGNYSDDVSLYIGNYVSPGSEAIGWIDKMNFSWNGENNTYFMLEDAQGNINFTGQGSMAENGLFTYSVDRDGKVETRQFVYFYGGVDGIVLSDGVSTYCYNANYCDRFMADLEDNLSIDDMGIFANMQKAQIDAILEKKANLLEDLAAAFAAAGIAVQMNEDTGEITMDSSVLFAVNQYAVSDAGKELLKKFINVYASVVFDEKYEGFISNVRVEGHTDTTGDYSTNLTLSENRAKSVMEYCLSEECGVESKYLSELETSMQAIGYSFDKPVYNAVGEVDMDASRRVSFRFLINLN